MIPYLEALENDRLSSLDRDRLLIIIRKIREVFEDHFDRTWLAIIIDGLPIDFRTIRQIRLLVSLQSIHDGDERALYHAVSELEQFIIHVRRYLLPGLKERLGVSGLVPDKIVKDKQQYIIRRFVAYTFPYNLDKLSHLTFELKNHLRLLFPLIN